MIRAIDRRITAAYQLLVNVSGRKPMWWGEQCAYLLAVALGLGLFAEMTIPRWLHLVMSAAMLFCVMIMWVGSRVPELWAHQAERASPLFRALFVVLMGDQALQAVAGIMRPHFLLMCISMVSHEYFLLCKDPPPPKPRTSNKLATEGTS